MRWADVAGFQTSTFNLSRESRRDYIAIYAENEAADKAFKDFDTVFGSNNRDALWDLGRELDKNGQFEPASKIYRSLFTQSQSVKDKLSLQTHLLYDLYRLRRWSELENEITSTPNEGKPFTGEGKEEIEPRLREIAIGQHFEFQKEATPSTYNRLEIVDRHYLRLFGNENTSQPVRYELGLLLLNRKQYQPAIEELEQHWKQHKADLKEPLKEQSLRNLLFALERKEAKAEGTKLSPNAELLLTLTNEYRTLYPKGPNARVVAES